MTGTLGSPSKMRCKRSPTGRGFAEYPSHVSSALANPARTYSTKLTNPKEGNLFHELPRTLSSQTKVLCKDCRICWPVYRSHASFRTGQFHSESTTQPNLQTYNRPADTYRK